eukprot:gb/GFBE01078169.1/.p1 GENE.gb/GFBE01078169.1/~~gb/GFBE01078169.1/.p1  ORF type:complete len:330 (+),score=75.72 gb/GFBE01078169.1/:1-990(+)
MKDVANSCWYDYIGAILSSTLKVVVEILDFNANVMVHCSDGWDRTAQVCSLAELCLDPYFRTQAGFLKLVQKEWCSFGHRFRTRAALGEQPTQECSPVFVQWLDCVSQLLRQFPDAFEFSDAVLLRLTQEVYSNLYGTFLCDNEQERLSKVQAHTVSLWSVLLRPDEVGSWRNPSYQEDRFPLVPSVCQANYVVWEAYWFRFHVRGDRSKAPSVPAAAAVSASSEPDPFAPNFTPPAVAQAPPPAPMAAVSAEPPSLFTPEELIAPPRRAAPVQVFADDDDEDVFSFEKLRPKTDKASKPEGADQSPAAAAAEPATKQVAGGDTPELEL